MVITEKRKGLFFRKVIKDGPIMPHMDTPCWVYSGAKDKDGYHRVCIHHISVRAHRFMWVIFNGDIPDGYYICHTCDNPSCVNPEHLFLGTPTDNAQDRDRKGRNGALKGQDVWLSKLTEEQVRDIRNRYLRGDITQLEIARQYNVSRLTISAIIVNRSWKHIEPSI